MRTKQEIISSMMSNKGIEFCHSKNLVKGTIRLNHQICMEFSFSLFGLMSSNHATIAFTLDVQTNGKMHTCG